mmetsp:Transcript_18321/g.13317  ORF Transcript_18321/g.13317 Transcript_18321/m.13317 type:complete len:107 (+) Transcript_18321:186-506(+)
MHGSCGLKKFVVTELYSYNLKGLMRKVGSMFSIETVCFIGLHLVRTLENIHNLGFLHLDIKPENVMLKFLPGKRDLDSNSLVLIDYGISKKYVDANGFHIPFCQDL